MVRPVGQLRITVEPAQESDFVGAEELLERLAQPAEALENLCRIARVDESQLIEGEGWCARIHLDNTWLLVRTHGATWTIYAAASEPDAMLAARRLHGLIGERPEGWDLDR
jgi:hypothetical protein